MKPKSERRLAAFHRRDARGHDDFEASLVLELRQVRQIALKLHAERFAFLQTFTAITTHRTILRFADCDQVIVNHVQKRNGCCGIHRLD